MFHFRKKVVAPPPWNKGKLIGQKPPLKLREIWGIRIRLEITDNYKELALFNLAIDSKLRSCDLVKITLKDVTQGGQVSKRAKVLQKKTHRPVQFELTKKTRNAVADLIQRDNLQYDDFLFNSPHKKSQHISTRHYQRIVRRWISSINLNPSDYGTHSLRRTKATLIYRKSKDIRAVQLLLGHSQLDNTIRYLGIEVEDALEIAEQTEA